MKKIFLCLSICLSCCLMFTQITNAEEYYYEETIEILNSSSIMRSTKTITGKKTASMKNSSGKILWSVSVTGTFTYTGSKATCTSAIVDAKSSNSFWKIKSKSSSKTSNKATGKATGQNIVDGVVVATHTLSTTLTCSASGKLS